MIPMNTPKIYDGMVVFQKLPATLSMFDDISDFLINKIVADHYLRNFIKSLERKGRFTFNMEHHQQRRCMTCLKIR